MVDFIQRSKRPRKEPWTEDNTPLTLHTTLGRARSLYKWIEFEYIPYDDHGADVHAFLKDLENGIDRTPSQQTELQLDKGPFSGENDPTAS